MMKTKEDKFDQVWYMMKTKQDNDDADGMGVVYAKNEI